MRLSKRVKILERENRKLKELSLKLAEFAEVQTEALQGLKREIDELKEKKCGCVDNKVLH